MKKLLFWLYILWPTLIYGQMETPKIGVDIRGVRCQGGSGLCSILGEQNKITSNSYILKGNENSIVLVVEANSKNLQNMDYFVQEEDYLLEKNTLVALGINPKWQLLKKGKYTFTREKEGLKVIIALSEI